MCLLGTTNLQVAYGACQRIYGAKGGDQPDGDYW